MSNEQENGEKPSILDDIHSLGVCLYESLCGHRISTGSYEELSAKDEAIPPAIDVLVRSCIASKATRLQSAKEFRNKLASAFQPHASLSKILTEGQLHELLGVLGSMSPIEFIQLPVGQRSLILSKGQGVVASPEEKLKTARFEFLRILPVLARQVKRDQYAAIIRPALEYAFEKSISDSWTGHSGIRHSLSLAAGEVEGENYHVVVETMLTWLEEGGGLANRDRWFYHAIRSLIGKLLANTHCDDNACERLIQQYDEAERRLKEAPSEADDLPQPNYEEGYTDLRRRM